MKNTSFFATLRELIARDELPAALEQLRALLAESPLLDEALHQSGRFENIRKEIRLGMVSHAEANLTQNQIRAALLELIGEAERSLGAGNAALRTEFERAVSVVNAKNVVVGSTISAGGDVHIGDKTILTESSTSRRLRLFLFLLVPVLCLGAAYLWYKMQPVSLTVRAIPDMPIPDLPFREGEVVFSSAGRSQTKTIATEVVFTDIPRGERVDLHFRAPGFIPFDTTFSMSGNRNLPLRVRRDSSLMRITGTVKDPQGRPVAGCVVIVAGVRATSDATGRYALEIPYLMQRPKQAIRAVKDGREGANETQTIVPQEDNDILFQ